MLQYCVFVDVGRNRETSANDSESVDSTEAIVHSMRVASLNGFDDKKNVRQDSFIFSAPFH